MELVSHVVDTASGCYSLDELASGYLDMSVGGRSFRDVDADEVTCNDVIGCRYANTYGRIVDDFASRDGDTGYSEQVRGLASSRHDE